MSITPRRLICELFVTNTLIFTDLEISAPKFWPVQSHILLNFYASIERASSNGTMENKGAIKRLCSIRNIY